MLVIEKSELVYMESAKISPHKYTNKNYIFVPLLCCNCLATVSEYNLSHLPFHPQRRAMWIGSILTTEETPVTTFCTSLWHQ